VPVFEIVAITGAVSVLLVNVCAAAKTATVSPVVMLGSVSVCDVVC
jgi:hypothetical protein